MRVRSFMNDTVYCRSLPCSGQEALSRVKGSMLCLAGILGCSPPCANRRGWGWSGLGSAQ